MADAAELLEQLLRDYGGPAKLSTVEISVCKSLAVALAADAPDGRIISSLTALLPPKPSASDTPYNLAFLDSDEFALLDALSKKATGEKVALPVNALLMSTRRDFTIREQLALEMAQLLDVIEARDVFEPGPMPADQLGAHDGAHDQQRLDWAIAQRRRHLELHPPGPTADERQQLSNLLTELFGLVARIEDIQPWLVEKRAPAPTPPAPEKLLTGAPAGNAGPSTPPPAPAGPSPDNVVALRRDIHGGEHSLARSDGPLLGGVSNQRKSFERFDNNGPLP